MSLFILDTDTLSLYQRGDPAVSRALRARRPGELAITVISVEEQVSGWYALLRRAQQPPELARAYHQLATSVQMLAGLRILTFTEAAIARYEQLGSLRLNIRKMDLRIAAIVLENAGTLVTRNARDFQRVPGLVLENWAA